MALTKRQREILDFVCAFVDEHRYSPSLEEIGAHFGLSSVATVHKHVQHLVDKGYVRKAWNRSRSVEPIDSATTFSAGSGGGAADGLVRLPLLGTVAAGSPIEAIEGDEEILVPSEFGSRGADCFVLRVRGESMIEDQIADGDLVVVESRNEARNGETVVAMLDGGDVTLKRFYRKGSRVRLVPANATMTPLEMSAADVRIRGVVRGLLRHY